MLQLLTAKNCAKWSPYKVLKSLYLYKVTKKGDDIHVNNKLCWNVEGHKKRIIVKKIIFSKSYKNNYKIKCILPKNNFNLERRNLQNEHH